MPTAFAESREDKVVQLLTSRLEAAGSAVKVLDRPDRNPNRDDGLTVDLEVLVDGRHWAIDVMVIRWASGLEGATGRIKARLVSELGHRVPATKTLELYCHPAGDAQTIESLIKFATLAVETGRDQSRGDEAALLRPRHDGEAVEVLPWLGTTPDLAEEISFSSGQAVRNKLHGQVGRARELGYLTALALDQSGAEDLAFGANFLASPSTILSVVEAIERDESVAFDGLVLVTPTDDVQLLRWEAVRNPP